MLRDTHVPVRPDDGRRLDLIVPGLPIARGQPLFCDVTCVSPLSVSGLARSGATTIDGAILRDAERENERTYNDVTESGLGRLCCLGVEPYGRWSTDALDIVPAMAYARAEGLNSRIRTGTAQALQHRWWGILGVAAQRALARCVLLVAGAALPDTALESPPPVAELVAL